MTCITFQFVPDTELSVSRSDLEAMEPSVKSIDQLENGFTSIRLSDGNTLEYDVDGSLRYSIRVDDLSKERLELAHDTAVDIAESIFTDTTSSRLSIVLKDEDAASVYISEKSNIEAFISENVNTNGYDYTEMGRSRIRLFFNNSNSEAVSV